MIIYLICLPKNYEDTVWLVCLIDIIWNIFFTPFLVQLVQYTTGFSQTTVFEYNILNKLYIITIIENQLCKKMLYDTCNERIYVIKG
jgi:hypothetical protein